MFRKTVVLAMLLLLVFFGVNAYAQAAAAKNDNAGTKLWRGVVNVITSPLEVPKQIYLTSKSDHIFSGVTYGTVKGFCFGVMRFASGVYDTVTFPVPRYGMLLMEPKYVFDGWE